jgi:hypothetical protein
VPYFEVKCWIIICKEYQQAWDTLWPWVTSLLGAKYTQMSRCNCYFYTPYAAELMTGKANCKVRVGYCWKTRNVKSGYNGTSLYTVAHRRMADCGTAQCQHVTSLATANILLNKSGPFPICWDYFCYVFERNPKQDIIQGSVFSFHSKLSSKLKRHNILYVSLVFEFLNCIYSTTPDCTVRNHLLLSIHYIETFIWMRSTFYVKGQFCV